MRKSDLKTRLKELFQSVAFIVLVVQLLFEFYLRYRSLRIKKKQE